MILMDNARAYAVSGSGATSKQDKCCTVQALQQATPQHDTKCTQCFRTTVSQSETAACPHNQESKEAR